MMNQEEFIILVKENLQMDPDSSLDEAFDKEALDSLDKVNLIVLIEDFCGQEVSVVELLECNTIHDILALISA